MGKGRRVSPIGTGGRLPRPAYSAKGVDRVGDLVVLDLLLLGLLLVLGRLLRVLLRRRGRRTSRGRALLHGHVLRSGGWSRLRRARSRRGRQEPVPLLVLRRNKRRAHALELAQDVEDRVEHLGLERGVVSNELVDCGSEVDRRVSVAKQVVVGRRGEDGKVLGDEIAGEEVVETGLIQAESPDRVRDGLQDVVRSRNGALERVVQGVGDLGLLQRGQRRRLVVDERRGDVRDQREDLRAEDEAVLHDLLGAREERRVDEVAESLRRA